MTALLLLLAIIPQNYPKPSGYVVDRVGVMDRRHAAAITSLSEGLRRKTGAQLAVAVVKTVKPETIEGYSIKLAEQWGVGAKGKDNGVLLVVAMDDHEYRIEVGYGLEKILNDAAAGDVGREYLVPHFKAGNYSDGIYSASVVILQKIAAGYRVDLGAAPAPVQAPRRSFRYSYVVVAILLIVGLFSWRGSGSGCLPLFFMGSGRRYGWGRRYRRSSFGVGWGGGFGGSSGGGFGGGGFGGFGGGSFGGGGASGSW